MRICLVAPYYAPHIGGVETAVQELAKFMVDRGEDVTVLTSRYSRHMPALERREGVVVKRVPTMFVAFRTPMMPAVHNAILEGEWDIVHSHTPPPFTAYFAVTAANTLGVPHALTYHCDDEIPVPAIGPVVVALYRESLGRYTLSHSDQVITSTPSYARTSRLAWRYDPEVVGNAVDVDRFNPMVDGSKIRRHLQIPPAEEAHMVMSVGRLVPHKGVEFLLEAVPMMNESAHVVIVGRGEWRGMLEESARRLGIAHRVTFAGSVPWPELPNYHRAADIFVLPSISRLEAFGIVGLEAMSSQRPVVLSDIPGVRDVIEDGKEGLLSRPTDPKDIAEKVNTLIADPQLRLDMGERGRKRVLENFSWEVIGERYLEIYQRMLDSA